MRLAGLAGVAFGWSAARFWGATPDELAALVRVLVPAGEAPLARDDLARLMEAHPDG